MFVKLSALTLLGFTALSGAAFAADLYVPPAAPVAVAPAASGWEGFYAGAHVGYGPGKAQAGYDDDLYANFSGFFGGVQAGYNWEIPGGGLVLGVEGDINAAHETGDFKYHGDYAALDVESGDSYDPTTTVNWTGALTGHIGYDFGGFMPYLLGGVAFANNTVKQGYYSEPETSDLIVDDESDHSESQTHTGYTVGAGLAAMLGQQISVFGEVRYSDYGKAHYDNVDDHVGLTDTSYRVGFNYHFN